MLTATRRDFLKAGAAGMAVAGLELAAVEALAELPGDRPKQEEGVRVLIPQTRVPLSFIRLDLFGESGPFFGMPQFAEVWPNRKEYQKPWQRIPREIPDAFVRKFGEWCQEWGVKGKYSIVPYPACVGWVDRDMPGWSHKKLLDSLELVRKLMVPNWDIHFRHLYTDEQSVAPRVEYASGLDGSDPKCVVSMIGCTGDWFGGWDGMTPGSADRFITEDLKTGRMVEVIERGEPSLIKPWEYLDSQGRIHFDNGTLTADSLVCAIDDLAGTGTINTHGLVSDVDLVYDATHELNQVFHINSFPNQNITLNLDVDDYEGIF